MLSNQVTSVARIAKFFQTGKRSLSISSRLNTNVSLLGASKHDGQLLSLLLKQNPHIKNLKLFDTEKDLQGLSMDLSHIDTQSKVTCFTGMDNVAASMQHADIVIFNHLENSDPTDRDYVDRLETQIEETVQQMHHLDKMPIVLVVSEPITLATSLVGLHMYREKIFDAKKLIGCVTKYTTVANKLYASHFKLKPENINFQLYFGVEKGSMYLYREGDLPEHCAYNAETEVEPVVKQVEQFFEKNKDHQFDHLSAYSAYRLVSSLITSFQRKRMVVESGLVFNEKIYLSAPLVLGNEGVEQLVINHDLESAGFFKKLDKHIDDLDLFSERTKLLNPQPAYNRSMK